MTATQRPGISVVIVTYQSRDEVAAGLPPLVRELAPEDELIVVDNASTDGTLDVVAQLAPLATVVRNRENAGFCAACNTAAERASGRALVFLNPDAVVGRGFGDAIRRPLLSDPAWDAWMGLVTAEGGRVVNTSGNVVHFTGIAWAGEAGRPIEEADVRQREVPYLSGACLAIRREVWDRVGGFPEHFFMYHEDLDLSLRVRLAGGRLGLEPDARVEHAYEFHKGQLKWRLMERNRWAVLARTYPGPLLVLIAPALVATEAALIPVAFAGGWGSAKLAGDAKALGALPRLLRERREISKLRRIDAAAFSSWLTADLSSDYLGRPASWRWLTRLLRAYWATARLVLAFGARRRRPTTG